MKMAKRKKKKNFSTFLTKNCSFSKKICYICNVLEEMLYESDYTKDNRR